MDTKRVGAIAVPQRLEAWRVLLPTIRCQSWGCVAALLRACSSPSAGESLAVNHGYPVLPPAFTEKERETQEWTPQESGHHRRPPLPVAMAFPWPKSVLTRSVKEKQNKSEAAQTLCSPVDCSPPGSSVHGIFQARILEWVAISFSKEKQRWLAIKNNGFSKNYIYLFTWLH
ncbi:hypothetical protein R6Z07M_018363 [Ovis aries]